MAKLPVGVQNFSQLIQEGFTYVDKTEFIYSLVTKGASYFFSRPRRFGKSLLVSTLEALFQGKRGLFRDTWIDRSDYPWTSFPVLRFDFSMLASDSPEKLTLALMNYFEALAEEMEVPCSGKLDPASSLVALVQALAKRGPVVLLIDEYDHPLTRHIENSGLLEVNRKILSSLFTTIKGLQSTYVRYLFITGVSRFSKVSLFSGMNNLEDISLSSPYGTLTGFTEKEIAETFAEPLELVAQKKGKTMVEVMEIMRKWYNGYLFDPLADRRVFNPWSIINYLKSGRSNNYWFNSGTPIFAIDLIKKSSFLISELETGVEVSGDEIEASSDVYSIPVEILLFQTGYLTIDSFDEEQDLYCLQLPNEEVRRSLIKHLFLFLTKKQDGESRKLLKKINNSSAKEISNHFLPL